MVLGLCHCKGFSLVVASGDYSLVGGEASRCGSFSCHGTQALGHAGSVVVAQALSHSTAYGIFPGRGSNSCLLHWQVDSLPQWATKGALFYSFFKALKFYSYRVLKHSFKIYLFLIER